MQLNVTKHAELMVITVQDERIDASVVLEFKEVVRRAADAGPARVILDLSHVQFLDSSGLGAVVSIMKLLAPEQTLELAALTEPVAKVFRLTRMDTIFTIHAAAPSTLRAAG